MKNKAYIKMEFVPKIIFPLNKGGQGVVARCSANDDGFVKSPTTHLCCHSGLSGIGCFCNALKKKDSGQAGMTTFYESINHINFNKSEVISVWVG